MLLTEQDKVGTIIKAFSDHTEQKSHSRHISKQECTNLGLKVTSLEDDAILQDTVLTIHHSFMATFMQSRNVKMIENHLGKSYIETRTIR